MKKIDDVLSSFRALATHTFQNCTPQQQARAEEIARELVEQANNEGIAAVAGTMIGAADMLERVARVMGKPE